MFILTPPLSVSVCVVCVCVCNWAGCIQFWEGAVNTSHMQHAAVDCSHPVVGYNHPIQHGGHCNAKVGIAMQGNMFASHIWNYWLNCWPPQIAPIQWLVAIIQYMTYAFATMLQISRWQVLNSQTCASVTHINSWHSHDRTCTEGSDIGCQAWW